MSSMNISQAQARQMVLSYLQSKAAQMARGFREVKAYLGMWRGQPVYMNLNEQIGEVAKNTEIGFWLLQVTLNEIGSQQGIVYVMQ